MYDIIHVVSGLLLGASSISLFARVGGGIFTKAADVGADLVGKVEACIPEDDSRNPAVIADNVGDNVGDIAGMGADLCELYLGSIISTMILGAAAMLALSNQNIGLLIGAMLPFLFSALSMLAVGRAAHEIVLEVRRQFKANPCIMKGTEDPDYERCISISTSSAIHEMILPGLIAIVAPLFIGLLLGKEALGGLLVGSIGAGVMLALTMVNAGGAWDNAKKYIELGFFGGKGSAAHKAGVTGDTVGDPFKDTSRSSTKYLAQTDGNCGSGICTVVFVNSIHFLFLKCRLPVF